MTSRVPLFVLLSVALVTTEVAAQSVSPPIRRLEVSVGAGFLTGADLGQQPANERAASGSPYRLFDTETDLSSSLFFGLRLGFALTPRLSIEGAASLGQPELRTSISGDAEGAESLIAVEQMDQYTFDGGIVYRFGGLRGLVPFVSAGAGYQRQRHEGETLIEGGGLFYAGGGVTHWLSVRKQGTVKAIGLRGDARLYFLSGGITPDDMRTQAAFAGSFVMVF
ncbi:MAG TPA: hypothetical protein VFO58_19235 [Vicinamibacterales bacterium]|nr:hypothetical protein [Vicinamibacterales bacterium]